MSSEAESESAGALSRSRPQSDGWRTDSHLAANFPTSLVPLSRAQRKKKGEASVPASRRTDNPRVGFRS